MTDDLNFCFAKTTLIIWEVINSLRFSMLDTLKGKNAWKALGIEQRSIIECCKIAPFPAVLAFSDTVMSFCCMSFQKNCFINVKDFYMLVTSYIVFNLLFLCYGFSFCS